MEPISIAASTIIALAFQKFLDAGSGKLGEKFTEGAIAQMDDLRKLIWNKLRGKSPKVDEALQKAEQGDKAALETIAKNLDVVMDEEPEFANEVRLLAQTINAGKIQDNSTMNQWNSDNARGWQTKVEGGTAYIGENKFYDKSGNA